MNTNSTEATAPIQAGSVYDNIPIAVFDVSSVYLGLLTFFGIINNGTVLVLFARYKRLQNPINLFLINISVSDLSVAVLASPFTFASNISRRWLFGAGGCTWYAFAVTLCGVEQIVSLAAVSVQRYYVVVRPNTARKMNTRWALIFILLTWSYSLAVSLPPALGWNSYILEATGTACSVNWTSSNPGDSSYIIFIFTMVLVIPLFLIVGSYSLIIRAVKKISSTEAAMSSQHKVDKKVTIMVVVMITCFLVAWTPYAAFSLYATASKNNNISPVVASLPALFAKSCTVYNPVIYFLLNRQFKDAFIDMICCGRNPLPLKDEPARAEASNSRDRGELGEPNVHGRQEAVSASLDTHMLEIGAAPSMSLRHVKPEDRGGNKVATSSQQQQPIKPKGSKQKAVKQTPVETFQFDEEETHENDMKEETVKKHSKSSHKSGEMCLVEHPGLIIVQSTA